MDGIRRDIISAPLVRSSEENQSEGLYFMAIAPGNTACNDWCISERTTLHKKVNTPKELMHESHTERTIEITEYDEDHVQLISSDEDERVEVDDPPQPTITIESFDEDKLEISSKHRPGVGSKVNGQVSSVVRHVDIKRTIQIIEFIELDSSDEEDEIEVDLTTQPKIIDNVQILSSDEDEDEEIDVVGLESRPNITIESFDVDETSMIDLADNDSDITENVVDYEDRNIPGTDISQFISTKYPTMLEGDMDFHNLKGTENLRERRTFCRESVRADMKKFYNESWGGEYCDHEQILKHMPRDKHLWVIDERDRLRDESTVVCDHCDLPGHRDDTCPTTTPVCYMCGDTGHLEPTCPTKNYCLIFDNNAPHERCDQSKDHEQYRSIYPPTPSTSITNQEEPNEHTPQEHSPVWTPHRNYPYKRQLSPSPTHKSQVEKKKKIMPAHEDTERLLFYIYF